MQRLVRDALTVTSNAAHVAALGRGTRRRARWRRQRTRRRNVRSRRAGAGGRRRLLAWVRLRWRRGHCRWRSIAPDDAAVAVVVDALDAAAAGRVVLGDGVLELRVVAQGKHGLHEALPVGVLRAQDERAVEVLQRASHDLRCGRGALVDEDGHTRAEGDEGARATHVGDAAVGVTTLGGDDGHAVGHELLRHLKRGREEPAGVAPEVENEGVHRFALACSLYLELDERGAHLRGGRCGELGELDVAGRRRFAQRGESREGHGVDEHLLAMERSHAFCARRIPVPLKHHLYRCSWIAAQTRHDRVQLRAVHRLAPHGHEMVPDTQAVLEGVALARLPHQHAARDVRIGTDGKAHTTVCTARKHVQVRLGRCIFKLGERVE
mmetsp:Transcript_9380/g.27857  ORF Transcript_9380/g.27857 Transcript_9380/m.27857 type:complete len:380 (-) Transcript_9380:651-1790(-)